jgi:Ca-activated chloride channel family protein
VLRSAAGGGAADATRRVLLFTDGRANAGITEPAALVGMATSARDEGVGTTTIGFGDHFAEDLLTAMGDAGGGNAHFADTPDAAPTIFAEEFEGLARVVAQNVSVEIRPGDDVAVVEVLNRYPATPVAGGVQLALGDAYGGERRAVVLTLHVPALADLGMAKVADVVLRYVGVGDQIAAHEVTLPLMVNVVSAAEAAQAQAAELLAEADQLDDAGDAMHPSSYDAYLRKRLHYQSHLSRRRRHPG